MDEVIAINDTNIEQATTRMNNFNLRIRQLGIKNRQSDIKSANVQRSRDSGGTAPPALLSYNFIVTMKPGSKGRHNMSNKEWNGASLRRRSNNGSSQLG